MSAVRGYGADIIYCGGLLPRIVTDHLDGSQSGCVIENLTLEDIFVNLLGALHGEAGNKKLHDYV